MSNNKILLIVIIITIILTSAIILTYFNTMSEINRVKKEIEINKIIDDVDDNLDNEKDRLQIITSDQMKDLEKDFNESNFFEKVVVGG